MKAAPNNVEGADAAEPIALDDVIDDGFEALHGKKMKVLVHPSI